MEQQQTDEATLQQMSDISQNIVETQPLISESSSILAALYSTYADNSDSPGFLTGLTYLDSKYARIRRVRGDGNCFYRFHTQKCTYTMLRSSCFVLQLLFCLCGTAKGFLCVGNCCVETSTGLCCLHTWRP